MGIDAVAVLRLAPTRLRAELAAALDANQLTGKNGLPFTVRPLADGVGIVTGAPLATPGDELSLLVRQLLGPLLDEHGDARGIFLVPDVAARGAADETYDALVERVGDAGEWTPVVPEGYVPERLRNAPPGSLDAALGQIMGALDPSLVQEMTRAVFSGDPQAFAEAQSHLAQALPPSALGELRGAGEAGQAGALGGLGGLGDLSAIEDAVKNMMGGMPSNVSPGDFQAALKKAQELMAENPDLQSLLGQLQGKPQK